MTLRASDASPRPLTAMVVGGTHSGVGKTTLTLGLIAALRRRGLTVQPFKVGPDFIDPLHHTHARGRRSKNLDGWMLTPEVNRRRFAKANADADVAVIEGVMGLFDGSEGKSDRGSTAEMAKLLGLPVVLVVDASAMARSAAAVIHGFSTFDPPLKLAGVILNRVGGPSHAGMIREAVGEAVPILGVPRAADLAVPERHLGLHLPHEARTDYVERAATLVDAYVSLDELLERSRMLPAPVIDETPPSSQHLVRIGVARDEAFCFYYDDNLALLMQEGAELVEFSPIRDPLPDDVDGLYVGGGYPELHADALARNEDTTRAIREFASAGGPVYGECGGLMYLGKELRVDGAPYAMCGVMPFSTRMPAGLRLAYVDVTTTGGLFGAGHRVRGHMFHHSEIDGDVRAQRCYQIEISRGERSGEGYVAGNALASYAHLHFASDPTIARAFVAACLSFQSGRVTSPRV